MPNSEFLFPPCSLQSNLAPHRALGTQKQRFWLELARLSLRQKQKIPCLGLFVLTAFVSQGLRLSFLLMNLFCLRYSAYTWCRAYRKKHSWHFEYLASCRFWPGLTTTYVGLKNCSRRRSPCRTPVFSHWDTMQISWISTARLPWIPYFSTRSI